MIDPTVIPPGSLLGQTLRWPLKLIPSVSPAK